MVDQIDLVWPVLLPLCFAALCACLWNFVGAQRVVALVGVAAQVYVSFRLLFTVLETGPMAIQFGGWAPPFGITFVADALGAVLVATTGVVVLAVGIYALYDMRDRHAHSGFHPLFFGLVAAVNGSFLTGDIFNLYVWFEIMLISSLGLLAITRSRAQIDGAIKYGILNLFGTILFIFALAMIYGAAGTMNMADLARIVPDLPMTPGLTAAALMLIAAFGIKAGAFPLFFWLPASYHAANFAVGAIFAGLLTKVGVYAIFRVFTLIYQADDPVFSVIFTGLAGTTMIIGVVGAIVQTNIRRMLSFLLVSHIGNMLMGLAIATPEALTGATFYIVHHIVVMANLFMVAGAIAAVAGSDNLGRIGGLLRSQPLLALLFLIPALSLSGVPPFSGFWGKFLLVDAAFRAESYWLAFIMLLAGFLTLYGVSRIWMEAFWKEAPITVSARRRLPPAFAVSIALLGAVTVGIGLFAQPLVELSLTASAEMLDPAIYVDAVFGEPDAIRLGGAQ